MSMSEQIAYLRKERELREMRKNKKEEGEGGEGGEQGEGRKEEQENEQDENEYSSHGRERFESGFPRYQTNGSKDSFDEEPLFSDRRIGVNENSNEAAEQSEQTEQQESYPPILSPALRFSSSKANLMMHNLTGAHEGFGERGKEGEFNADVREEEE